MAGFQAHISKCSERGVELNFFFFFIGASATKRFAGSRIFTYGCLMIFLSNRQKEREGRGIQRPPPHGLRGEKISTYKFFISNARFVSWKFYQILLQLILSKIRAEFQILAKNIHKYIQSYGVAKTSFAYCIFKKYCQIFRVYSLYFDSLDTSYRPVIFKMLKN